jgi:DNA-binding SARP family transcriptional activator
MRLIGQMEAWTLTSESVLPAGRKTRALLAVIALSSPRPALRGRLAELLWSRRPEEQARASLRQEIHRLLEALAPGGSEILLVTRDHLSLRPGKVWVDVEEVMRATTDQPAALSLLDGDLLEGLDGIDPTFDAWLTTERERLRDRARTVAEARCTSRLIRRRRFRLRSACCRSTGPRGRLARTDAGSRRARRAWHGHPGV